MRTSYRLAAHFASRAAFHPVPAAASATSLSVASNPFFLAVRQRLVDGPKEISNRPARLFPPQRVRARPRKRRAVQVR